MRLGLLTLVSLLLLSCSPTIKKTALLPRPATPAPELEDQPGEAIEFDRLKRVLGADEIPVERYFTAIDHINRMPAYSSARKEFVTSSKTAATRDASLGDWTELGPGNIGGRVSSLLIRPDDPKIMYAGAVAGGVFKTTDGGASWTPTADQLPNIAVSAMAMDPKDPNVIYAGTGQCCAGSGVRGAGILKTTDGGDTWTRLRATTSQLFYYVNKITISPNDSRRVYAATWAGVMVSVDAGESWALALNRSSPKLGCQDLVIRTDQPTDYLFAACGLDTDQAIIFRNANAAGSGKWTEVYTEQNMARTTLALAPSNQSVIYALASSSETGAYHNGLLAVFRSTSNGDPDTWEARVRNTDSIRLNGALLSNPFSFFADECRGGTSNPNNQGFHAIAIAVDPLDAERVWAGGIDLFRSDDGGVNWGLASQWWNETVSQYAHADHKALVFHPGFDGVSNQILFDANDGGVFRTENARDATGSGAKAACTPSTSKVTWTSLNHNFGATQFYHGQVYPGGHLYMAGAQDNGTSRGSDATGNDGWQRLNGGDGGYVAIDPNDVNRIYFETTELSLRRSLNGGATSTSAVSGITEPAGNFLFITPFLIDPNDSSRLWVGGKTIWRSGDSAQKWSPASARIAGGSVSALAIAPGKPERALVGSSTGYIHRTDNAGAADENTDWPFVLPRKGYVSSLAFDPSNPDIAYATYSTFDSGSDAGHVFKSVDGGATWTLIDGQRGASIPDVPVECILIDPANPSVLYLGTDLGVFVSVDGGASWAKEDTRFPNTMVESLAIDRNGGASTLFAFTRGRGVWRVRLGGHGPSCVYSLDPSDVALPAFGGSVSIKVSTQDGCAWSAASGYSWTRMSSPAGGKGTGATEMTASVNPAVARLSGVIAISDQKLPVSVAGAEAPSGNDEIAAAAVVAQLPYVARLDTTGATANNADPVHSCTQSRDGKTVWFLLTARSSAAVTALSGGALSNVGTVLSAYSFDGRIGPELACARQAARTSQIKFSVAAGRSYLIELSAPSTSNGGGDLLLELF